MTDRIDLDELDIDEDGEPHEQDGGDGDWLQHSADADTGRDGNGGSSDTAESTDAVPHVPRENKDRPVGIPVESGGAGTGAGGEQPDKRNDTRSAHGESTAVTAGGGTDSGFERDSGPHGGADDMTLAFSLEALQRLADPRAVCADANQWADWIGIVGDAPAHVLTTFQRDHGIDLDFFNGGGMGPAERLADIDGHSMFYAERMVLVGVDEADERIAETAGWEYVPLSEAAEGAGWTLLE